jgi:hypothetical protein
MFKGLLNWVKGLFTDSVKAFLNAVFTKARQEAVSALKDVAIRAVTEIQDTDMSNEEKRKAAFSKIKNYAVTRGIQAGDSTVNLVLEMAVSAIKG